MGFLFSFVFLISLNVWGVELQLPKLSSPVMDLAELLNESERKNLSELAYQINTQNGPQITVLSVPDMQGYQIEEFSIRVAEKWQLGSKEKDNGLLVIIAKAERQMRIEVGNGIEGEITDYDTAKFTKEIFPQYFRRAQYYAGLRLFMEEVGQKFSIKLNGENSRYIRRAPRTLPGLNMGFIVVVIILLSIIGMIFRKKPGLRGVSSGIGIATVGGLMGFPIMLIIMMFLIGSAIGLMGIGNVLAAIAYGRGGGSYGGGRFGGGVGWSGGGGGFSGGGSSGSW